MKTAIIHLDIILPGKKILQFSSCCFLHETILSLTDNTDGGQLNYLQNFITVN